MRTWVWRLVSVVMVVVVAVGGVVCASWLPGWSASTRDLVELVSWCVTILSVVGALVLWAWRARPAGTTDPAPSVHNSVTGNVTGQVVQGGNMSGLTITTASATSASDSTRQQP